MFTTYSVYLLVLFTSVIFVFFNESSINKNNKNSFIYISIFSIIIVSTLRNYNVGVDNYEYSEWFNTINTENSLNDTIFTNIIDYEPAFVIINYFLKYLNLNYSFALLFYSILIWVPIYSYHKYQKHFYFAIFVFITTGFLFFTFNGQRQAIAIAFVFLGTRQLLENKPYKFLLSIFIATMFHFSAILMLSIYFLIKIPKINSKQILIYLLTSLFLPISFFFGIISKVAFLFPYYVSYIENDNFMQSKSISAGVLYQVALEFIVLYYYKAFAKTNFEIKLFNLFFIGSILYNLFYGNLFISRIVIYLLFFQPFVFCIILYKLYYNNKYTEIFIIMLIFFLMFLYKILLNDSGCSPYTTIFN